MTELSIVIPTYNERENIKELIPEIDKVLTSNNINYEIIVVDDNSPDGTAEEVKRLSEKYNVKLIVRVKEKGLSSAVVEGFKQSSGKYIVVMDADFQHPPDIIPKIYEKLKEGYDLVIASKYLTKEGTKDWNFFRKLISKGGNLFFYIFFPEYRKIKDLMSGFFGVNSKLIKENIKKLNPLGYKILLEVLVKCNCKKVIEIPYIFGKRKYGESKLTGKIILEYILHVLKLTKESKSYAIKFAIVGSLGLLVNFGVFLLLSWIFNISRGIFSSLIFLISTEVGIIHNFIWHELWTFRPKNISKSFSKILIRLVGYHCSSAMYIIITQSLYYLFNSILFISNILSFWIAVVIGFMWNLIVSNKIIWGEKHENK